MLDDVNRGSIKYLNRYKQLISYEGMIRRRNITPTDIDGFIDYNGVSFVYIEGKLEGKDLDFGQRKALENVINSHKKAGHSALAIVFTHHCEPDQIIMAKEKPVKEVYTSFKPMWKNVDGRLNVLQTIEEWESFCERKNINI